MTQLPTGRRLSVFVCVVVLALVASACGDDSSTTAQPTTTTTDTTTTEGPTTTDAPGPVPTIVGGGSSFGECGGLCVSELRIEGAEVSLERRSWDRSLQVVATGTLSDDARGQVAMIERALAGVDLDSTYGCPDCADGGAAWIDLIPVEAATRATYEFGAAPALLADWERFRRDVSEGLAACVDNSLVTVAAGCLTEPGDPANEPFRIVGGGFSFGMCFGYCFTEIDVDGTTVTLTRRAWADISGEDFPEQVARGELTDEGRARLDDLEVALATQALQETYGCPDCADGGSGWVVVQDASAQRRSTFEYSDPPDVLAEADALLRGWIDTLRECDADLDITSAPGCEPAVDPS